MLPSDTSMPANERPDWDTLEQRLKHDAFRQPLSPDIKIWRYMDLPKFVSLISERNLVLPRLDMLADTHEGSLTTRTSAWIRKAMLDAKAKTDWTTVSQWYREIPSRTYVSCWHANEHESEAMWRLYCGLGGGVAIQSTYRLLAESIRNHRQVYIGCVNYIDYETQSIPDANIFAPAMHKRVAFAYEQEVRLVTSPFELYDTPPSARPAAIPISWECDIYVQKVHVSPYAPEYFYEAVRSVSVAFAPGLESRLVWSFLRAAPVF